MSPYFRDKVKIYDGVTAGATVLIGVVKTVGVTGVAGEEIVKYKIEHCPPVWQIEILAEPALIAEIVTALEAIDAEATLTPVLFPT